MPRKKWNQFSFDKQLNSKSDDYDSRQSENSPDRQLKAYEIQNSEESKFFSTFDYTVLTIIAIIVSLYYLTYFDSISWQLSSIGRIFLIKILPYYDWRPLKNEQCLIDSFAKKWNRVEERLNCDVCENLKQIDVYETLDEDILEERYINLDVPVILTKSLGIWPGDSKFVQELLLDGDFSSSHPCKLSTNIIKDLDTTSKILEKVYQFEEFFVHFQNCDLNAMKVLRRYTFRPDSLPATYSPILYNWLIWNQNYNTTYHKEMNLVEKLAIFGQLFGSTYVTLIPRKNCETICPYLSLKVSQGDMLIFTNLWDLEYRPYEKGENMAVILETTN